MTTDTDNSTHAQAGPWLDAVAWDERGLVPAIAQDADAGDVLMLAWMDRAALTATVTSGQATYWSRSRRRLWCKGETSGHVQQVVAIRLDCDGDAIVLRVRQAGGIACHTGRASCFYRGLEQTGGDWHWVAHDPVLKNPDEIYG